jgi:hypothetical protein
MASQTCEAAARVERRPGPFGFPRCCLSIANRLSQIGLLWHRDVVELRGAVGDRPWHAGLVGTPATHAGFGNGNARDVQSGILSTQGIPRAGATDRVPLPNSNEGPAPPVEAKLWKQVLHWPNGLQAKVFAAAAWIRQQKHPFATRKRSDRVTN